MRVSPVFAAGQADTRRRSVHGSADWWGSTCAHIEGDGGGAGSTSDAPVQAQHQQQVQAKVDAVLCQPCQQRCPVPCAGNTLSALCAAAKFQLALRLGLLSASASRPICWLVMATFAQACCGMLGACSMWVWAQVSCLHLVSVRPRKAPLVTKSTSVAGLPRLRMRRCGMARAACSWPTLKTAQHQPGLIGRGAGQLLAPAETCHAGECSASHAGIRHADRRVPAISTSRAGSQAERWCIPLTYLHLPGRPVQGRIAKHDV